MKKDHLLQLQQTALFRGVDADSIASMLDCLQAQTRTYKKGEAVFRQGEQLSQIAVVLEGKLHIQSDDYWGNHTIIADLAPGDLFGEAYVAPTSGPMLADVVCISDSVVALFQARRMLTVCTNACPFHSLVVQNLFYVLADKNRTLMQKLSLLATRTTRAKLTSYLTAESVRAGSNSFSIPFNRQQLADYLSVDRSAMSAELSKMRDEGLLEFDRDRFTLYH